MHQPLGLLQTSVLGMCLSLLYIQGSYIVLLFWFSFSTPSPIFHSIPQDISLDYWQQHEEGMRDSEAPGIS